MSPHLPVVKAKDLISYLCNRRGFVVERIRGSHYQLRHPATGRRLTVPMHREAIRRGTLREIMAAASLSPDDLRGV